VQIARIIHFGLAWLLAAGLIVQVFLAGLGVFAGASNFELHRNFGFALQALPFFMAIAAWVGRLGRRELVLAVVLFLLFFLQSFLLLTRETIPAIAALHPVNGFAMAGLAFVVARAAMVRRGTRDRVRSAPEATSA
jgi:Family of unknown function (DUF6220)